MNIGICGLGFVGNAIFQFLKASSVLHNVFVYDKYKAINNLDALLYCDIIYICLPTPFDAELGTYNMNEINNTIYLLSEEKYNGIILLKSTVLPTYCEDINKQYPLLKIIHNPEFLSAKTAIQDFKDQRHIILGYTSYSKSALPFIERFYKTLFPQSIISINTSTVSALTKLACNSFYATKVQYFTELYLLCQRINVDFTDVRDLMICNDWIHPMHTCIPGQDGSISFGGACLPKDISALNQYMADLGLDNAVIDSAIKERNKMREHL
jgi:nucleotide sugar dehydrogenase